MAEECIAIGRDYLEAKELLRSQGKLFIEWCNSSESTFSYQTVSRYMKIARELSSENLSSGRVSGAQVLEQLATAKDDIRDALLSHIENKKEVLKGNGKLFGDWCNSADSAFSYHHAHRFMRIARELSGNLSSMTNSGLGVAVFNQLALAKDLLKKDGKLFIEWCNSGDCPIGGYTYAKDLMKIAREFGEEKGTRVPFGSRNIGFRVLRELASAKDQVREALLEHIETKQEKGETVTVKEVFAPLKRQPPGAGA